MSEHDQASQFDAREILWKAKRYLWIALVPVVLSACAGILYLKIVSKVYESSVVITLDDPAQISAALQPLVSADRAPDQLAEKISRVRTRVLNRNFLDGICDQLGFARDPHLQSEAAALARKHPELTVNDIALRMAVAILGKRISIVPVGNNYIRIGVKDPSPDVARRTAAAIGDALIESTRRDALGRAAARGAFSEDQIAVATEKLRQSEAALRSYQESLISKSVVTGPVTEDNLGSVRELADAADKEMEQVRGRIQSDRSIWAQRFGPGQPLPDLRSEQSTALEGRLSELEASYGSAAVRKRPGDTGGEVSSFLGQIGSVRQQLLDLYSNAAQDPAAGLTQIQAQLASGIALDRAVLRSLQARKDRLNALVSTFLSSARSGPGETMHLEQLKNDVQTNRDLLATLQREATSSRLSEAYETSLMNVRIEVVEQPVLPITPVWPDPPKVIIVSLLVGPLLAVGLIAAMERVGMIIRTVEQAEREFGVKVIGTIPRIEGWPRPGSFYATHWAPIAIVGIILVTALTMGIISTVGTPDRHVTPRVGETSK
jgi:uncharacterized protein involved in exopolysaccharide biosynthesis